MRQVAGCMFCYYSDLITLCQLHILFTVIFELQHGKTNKVACAPSEDSDQPGHPPNPIRVFIVRPVDS